MTPGKARANGTATFRFAWTSPVSRARVARVELTFYEHNQATMQMGDLRRRTLRP